MKITIRPILILIFAAAAHLSVNGDESIESMRQRLPEVVVSLKEFIMSKEAADEMEFDWLGGNDTKLKFKDGVAILDKQSLMRHLTSTKRQRGIAGVFSDQQFQFIAKVASENPNVTLMELPPVTLRWGECALMKSGENVYGIAASAVESTINLELVFPAAGNSKLDETQIPESISIQDCYNVVYSEVVNGGQMRWIVVRAAISPKAEHGGSGQPATRSLSK